MASVSEPESAPNTPGHYTYRPHGAGGWWLAILGAVFFLLGLTLGGGGLWLAWLGGSPYYAIAGLGLIISGYFLYRRSMIGFWIYTATWLFTLAWAVWEVGLAPWPLVPRVVAPTVLMIVLLVSLPAFRRTREERTVMHGHPAYTMLLGAVLAAPLAIHFVPMGTPAFAQDQSTSTTDPAVLPSADNTTPGSETSETTDPAAMPAADNNTPGSGINPSSNQQASNPAPDTTTIAATGVAVSTKPAELLKAGKDWPQYGGTFAAQRYSPLDQITPANIEALGVAWHYNTGDEARPGDPVETTFEVTPLKIGDLLYLCTPHQVVVALDATTGEEVWRYDPEILGELALQHLTCRGLSYKAADDGPQTAGTTTGTDAEAAAGDGFTGNASVAEADELADAGELAEQATPAEPGGPGPGGTTPPAPVGEAGADLPIAAETAERTAATCDAKLFMPTADGRLIALDPADGAVCTSFGGGTGQLDLWENMPNVNPGGYYSTSPVVVTDDLVIVAGTTLDNVSVNEASGVIRAYDVDTGEIRWAFDTGAPETTEPLPPGETYTSNSPNSWSISAVDEELGMVYVPLGNQPPDQWGADRTDAVERFSSSVVALNLADGSVAWVFQTVHHDLWDYDVPSQPSLIDLTVGGETVPALVQPTKQGELYVLNRETGEPVLPVTEMAAPQGAVDPDHTAPTQPVSALSFDPPPLTGADMWGATLFDQLTCRIRFHGYRYRGRYTPPSLEGTLVYPGNFGVFNWGGIAVDPVRQIAFGTPAYLAFISRLIPRPDDETRVITEEEEGPLPALNENFGAPYAVELKPFTSFLGIPCQEPPWGYVAGADLTTGEIAWMHRNGTVRDLSPVPLPLEMGVPDLGGPVMTAGGVAFMSGTLDYFVRAYDVLTGEQLWEDRLPAGGQATPMTYLGRDGRQYVVVAAGGHGSLGTRRGDSVIAYALPDPQ